MKYFFIIVSICFNFSLVYSQQNKNKKNIKAFTWNLKKDLAVLLPNGTYSAFVLDEVVASKRRIEIQNKFTLAAQKNPNWFLEKYNEVEKTGIPMAYDSIIGLTKEEYEEFKNFMISREDMYVIPSCKIGISIIRKNNILSFKSSGKISI